MLNNIRIEEDLLGTREVPADAYYGVHTLRAIENFYISNSKISDIPEFVRGMVMVKKAAAMANKELQTIPKSVANAIIAASREEMIGSTLYLVGRDTQTGEIMRDADSCPMCKRQIINAGISQVVIRRDNDNYDVIDVADWVKNDELLGGKIGY